MNQPNQRQIHLDFHTSECIPDVGADFDPVDFAKTMKEAHVNSVTVFARGHHGWLYYPSEKFPELVHPGLQNKQLLLQQVRALHEQGIRAPIYITVQWDYHSATNHPEWLIRKPGGAHEGDSFTQAGFYQSLCVNTGYFDFLEAQTREICAMLTSGGKKELDGVFFDIVGIRPCLCASCRREMQQKGMDMNDETAVRRFAAFTMDRFKQRMTGVVRQYSDNCTIFYNAGHVGTAAKKAKDAYTHFELESLPSGGWGYLHFPATIRYARKLGLPCVGMTGKFHTSWGDFHSYKNQAALEFEAFRMLAFGCACSIGDQLEPRGMLNKATYKLIGKVYGQVEQLEAYGQNSVPVTDTAVVTAESPITENQLTEELLGACQMLDELAMQYDIVDKDMDFAPYKLLILTDSIPGDEAFAEKLNAYVRGGGKILAANNGGKTPDGVYPACFGVESRGKNELYPDFLVADGALAKDLEPQAEYVMYLPGQKLCSTGAKALLGARAPYFARTGEHFCSHRYTPSAKGEIYPAVFENDGVLIFSHPIFAQYRESAPRWCKLLVKNAVQRLIGDPVITHDGPSTLTVNVLEQPGQSRYCVHLLSYIPVRKSATIDIIEERTVQRNVTLHLNLPKPVKQALLVPENKVLSVNDGSITVPEIDGYAIVQLQY